jgi:methylated-DNA-[protein]-cysteine S-methyltransferase
MNEGYWDRIETALGTVSVAVDDRGRVTSVSFDDEGSPTDRREPQRCRLVCDQLREYLAGTRTRFDLALAPHGTPFQQLVWRGLTEIPYGTVCGYGDLARSIGKPGAARAVGQANGANPIPIIIPCHRVIAADGSIGGYSSGLPIKRRLLALETIELAA